MNKTQFIPNIIIGGGISGLLMAYRLQQHGENFILLERHNELGGRMIWTDFHGIRVTLGAGILRMNDLDGQALCKELNILFEKKDTSYTYHPSIHVEQTEIDRFINQIFDTYHKHKNELINISFESFVNIYFSAEFVAKLRRIVSYNDFWYADVHDTIANYPLKEILPNNNVPFYSIKGGWASVLEGVLNLINDKTKLHTSEEVTEINWVNRIITTSKHLYKTNRLFICTNIDINKIKLNIPSELLNTFNQIGSIPFVRFYAYYPTKHNVKNTYYVPGPLTKMIPMTENILMIAYSDNNNAIQLHDILKNHSSSNEIRNNFNKLVGNSQKDGPYQSKYFTDFVYKYWEHGIHYYIPHTEKIITNIDNIYLVGEMVSQNQGWVEGALNSVNETLIKLKF